MKKRIFLKIAVLIGLTGQVSYGTLSELCDSNIIESTDMNQLFKVHQLPRNITELGQATKAHLIACKMLEQGQGVKALPYLYEAEKFYIPESLTVLWDVSQGRYSKIPKDIQIKIENHLKDTHNYKKLEEFYKKLFTKNHQDLIRKSQKSTLSCAFDYISQKYFYTKNGSQKSKIANDHISFEQSLKTQRLSTPEQKIDIITSQEEMHLLKKIS